ncbi:MAG: sodium-dependent transporter [Steroidobacteraceae bacterium]|jgi:NSS family neurotransmitter:Na+ symporter|nr:sodium-dependent transporter [Steroidobacteraceae bacterium]
MSSARWSSQVAFYLATIGAAVGLGSIWRFPYLVGTQGGSAFILVFVVACVAIAVPMLAAEFLIGRRARLNPAQAAGAVAAAAGRSRAWNAIGVLGTLATFLIISYYTIIAGWVLAYAWKCASGQLNGLGPEALAVEWRAFLANPWEMGAWHLAFLALLGLISGRGVVKGLEVANRWRAPLLLGLLGVLVAYALATGDVARGLSFAFQPDFARIDAEVALTAIGQAFYATGVGMAMMIAYGAYAPGDSSLLRSATLIVVSILVVSVLATLVVFPLVFAFDMDPAQGPDLVFNVLPAAFALMPGGQAFGTLFFLLLVLAALTPSMAGLEPSIAWFEQHVRMPRSSAVAITIGASWLLGLASLLSFNVLADWRPLGTFPRFEGSTWFDVVDYFTANLLLPVGALMTAVFVGWRLPRAFLEEGFAQSSPWQRAAVVWLLRLVCPAAIVVVFVAALT